MSNTIRDPNPSSEAERIAAEGVDVRERIRSLVVDIAERRGVSGAELRRHAEQILAGARDGVKKVADERKAPVLHEVVDGLADGFTRAANATKLAIEEAEGRGQAFADEDLKQAATDLRTLQTMFTDTVSRFYRSLTGSLRDQVGDLGEHAVRASRSMQDPIESALRAAAKHPVKFAGESAAVGAGVARKAVGALFQAAGGFLQGAGEVIGGKPAHRRDEGKPGGS